MIKLVSRSLLLVLLVANPHLLLLSMAQSLSFLGSHFLPVSIVLLFTVIISFLYSMTNVFVWLVPTLHYKFPLSWQRPSLENLQILTITVGGG